MGALPTRQNSTSIDREFHCRMSNPANPSSEALLRWLLEAIPLSSFADVLTHVAAGWRDLFPASAVLVWGTSLLPRPFDAGFARENQPAQFFSTDQWPPAAPVADWLEQLPERAFGFSPASFRRLPEIALTVAGRSIGQVRLWTSDESQTAGDWSRLQQASAQLLAQALDWDETLQAAKLRSLAEFAAGAGHEINNPVATITGRVQGLLKDETDPERRRQLLTIGGQALRIRDMIGDTMLFARPPTPSPERLSLQEVLPEILEPLRPDWEAAKVTFDWQAAEDAVVFADRGQFAVVVTELLRNSLNAVEVGGHVRLSARSIDTPGGPMARIELEDDGETFSPADREHLFDPFYSGRQAGRGLGFGLPKCWRIVSNHHGRLDVSSDPDQGTRVTLLWPAHATAVPPT